MEGERGAENQSRNCPHLPTAERGKEEKGNPVSEADRTVHRAGRSPRRPCVRVPMKSTQAFHTEHFSDERSRKKKVENVIVLPEVDPKVQSQAARAEDARADDRHLRPAPLTEVAPPPHPSPATPPQGGSWE